MILEKLLVELDARFEVVERAAQSLIGCHCAGITHEGRRRVKEANHAVILGIEQILPALGNRHVAQSLRIDHEADRTCVDRNPVAVRIFEIVGNSLPALALVGFNDASLLGVDGKGNTQIHGISHRIFGFGDDLRDGLSRILVVNRNVNTGFLGNKLEHVAPACPLGGNVVADGGLAFLSKGAAAKAAHQQSGTKNHLAEITAIDRHSHLIYLPENARDRSPVLRIGGHRKTGL